jgi:hypothetical protein
LDVELISAWCRGLVAAALIGSALWKVRHRNEFARSLERAPRWVRVAAERTIAVPVLELLCGASVITPGRVGQISAACCLVLLVGFTAVLLRLDPSTGCGCWTEVLGAEDSRVQRVAFLTRNVILIVAACFAVTTPGPSSLRDLGFGLIAGAFLGLVVMELPQIAAVATFVQSTSRQPT